MKIGIVLNAVPGYSETFFYSKINGLAANGFEVYLFAKGKKNIDLKCRQHSPLPVHNSVLLRIFFVGLALPLAFLRSPRTMARFCYLERNNGIQWTDLVRKIYLNAHIFPHPLDWLHFGFATVAIDRELVAKAMPCKMAVSLRGYDINVYPKEHRNCYLKLWQQVDKVHSISNYLLKEAFKLGLPQTVESKIISPAIDTKNIRQRDDFEFHKPLRLLTIARLHPIKGLEVAIKAVKILATHGVDCNYVIVGEGDQLKELTQLAQRLGIANRVNLLGRKPHTETVAMLSTADLYLQPSINEGFCNALLEAQGHACLCIASRAGAMEENIVEGQTGFLVLPADESQLANAITNAMGLTKNERKEICLTAAKRVKEKFDIAGYNNAWKEFYEQ